MGKWLPIEYQVTVQLCTRRNHTRGLASMHSVLQGVWQGKRKVKSRLLLFVLKCCFPRLSSLPGSAPYKCSSLMHSFSSSIFSLLQTFWNVWVHRFCFLVHAWLSNSLCRQLVPTAHPLSVLCCCHFLFAQSCPPLCDPMDCSPPGSVYGILQTIIPECVAMPFSRGSSQPRDQTLSPTVQEDSLALSHLGSPWPHFCQVEKPRTSRERDAGGRKKNHRATEPLIIDSVCLSHSPCVFLLRNFDSLWKVWCLQGTFVLSACPREKLKCCIQRMINNYLLLPMLREKIPLLNLQFLLHY